ncbi:hypothetical protein B4098_1133 [Heyndrickxia coagulans]|uniref:Uncharacterized protein n=1 Tax=Heyndrickxia coagulans TaxID=1398 RepID=A0A150JRN2_HEYCO|nr:hypothetical protein B4098_1133 [Heyndrickxia coagulans]
MVLEQAGQFRARTACRKLLTGVWQQMFRRKWCNGAGRLFTGTRFSLEQV